MGLENREIIGKTVFIAGKRRRITAARKEHNAAFFVAFAIEESGR